MGIYLQKGFLAPTWKTPDRTLCVVTEQRALELVRGGEVKFFPLFLSPSYSVRARGGKGGRLRCHCMFVYAHVRPCVFVWAGALVV